MQALDMKDTSQYLRFGGTDLEIRAELNSDSVTIDILKSGNCVHRLTVDDALGRMEHGWIADLFAREDRIALSQLTNEADEFVSNLNINQG